MEIIMKNYEVIVVGSGLFGCVCAERLSSFGYKVLIVEKKNHIGGTCFTELKHGINVHKYGAHIFRTNNKDIYTYLLRFCELNNFVNSPIALHKKCIYNLPFNMNTFCKVWNITTPLEAKKIIDEEISKYGYPEPANLEEHAINLVGKTIYEMFIKEYTEKQWGRSCRDLPPEILKRIPIRFTFDNNYYNAKYQGVPVGGYTNLFRKMISNCDIFLNCDYKNLEKKLIDNCKLIIYTGPIDEYFNYSLGELEYRGLKFEEKYFRTSNKQGVAVINYSDRSIPYTRSIEHKHFEFGEQKTTIVSYEYPTTWKKGDYPFYPVNDKKNNDLYDKYLALAKKEKKVVFGGRLGLYKYFDMQDTIAKALELVDELKGRLK